ncbi:GlsB/YeaQ/YmgE family stress response membrane protein [Paeniglutamicibacter sp. ORCA_105]|jgi:uncharacterized membrane protein YeaQ/YmgE (transglycosylase-associated protein family)|uniref:GlsB/YeaQ/YmgE family stress response membrane protein n=1 Tax=Paeniglutamicibacter sp. ORCA_105 TaxID=3377336 RepID=UPI003894A07B
MGLLGWIVLGLIVGALFKNIMPGRAHHGWTAALLLGVLGAVAGGWLAAMAFGTGIGEFLNLRTWVPSILGAAVVAGTYGVIRQRRA